MMFQSFSAEGDGAKGPERLARLRAAMKKAGLDGFLIPRADAYQGEYVADRDARLRWLTGFSGSAGMAAVTGDKAAVFVDGRYRVQLRQEVDTASFTPLNTPGDTLSDWLIEVLPEGAQIGFDPWLHSHHEIETLEPALAGHGIGLVATGNLIDAIWDDQPEAPVGAVRCHDAALAGETTAERRARMAEDLRRAGAEAAVLTLPDSISWLLNIRGADIPRNPVVQSFAILSVGGHVDLFADPRKFDDAARSHLGADVTIRPQTDFTAALETLRGPVLVDLQTVPEAVYRALATPIAGEDPVVLAKARKTPAEIDGMRRAHQRDAVAMARFLAWCERSLPGGLTEIDVTRKLESLRREAVILDISFDTICGAGPHAALPHYRVSHDSNRTITLGEVLLIDSGGQYPDGTTDITRTIAVGEVGDTAREAFTRVLQGMIALSRTRFPEGLAGRDLDPIARASLWSAGRDFDHGTGHGVGAALCVHEGPARISRASEIPLMPGMILSNEPGYYREGAFGIRIENLVVVTQADSPDGRDMLGFETLSHVPIDQSMIVPGILGPEDIAWLNAYHAETRARIAPHLDAQTREWLDRATAKLSFD